MIQDSRKISLWLCMFVALANSLTRSPAPIDAAEPPNVLDVPAILQQQATDNMRAVALLQQGDLAGARLLLRQCVLRVPHDPMAVYNLACAHARLGEDDDAFEMLRAALKLGLRNKQQLQQDNDLASLRNKDEFAKILKGCEEPAPKQVSGWQYNVQVAQPKGLQIMVDHENMIWNQTSHVMHVFVNSADIGQGRLAAGATGALGDKILQWFAEGTAAGNIGDLYDNHDRAHSRLDLSRYPQLGHIAYGPQMQKRQMDNGPQGMFLYVDAQSAADAAKGDTGKADTANADAKKPTHAPKSTGAKPSPKPDENSQPTALNARRTIVIGNSSTAVTGSFYWRSMPRLILSTYGGVELLTQHYTHNHLYVYPEHKDHDPGHDANGWGDVFCANTPYYLISQGSSGSDLPILDSLAATLSAFPPETKKALREKGLMTPTLQMIFRRSYKPVQSDKDYLSGLAHPTVFDGSQVNADAMVEMAHKMQADDIPPIAALRVLEEKPADFLVDYFDARASEAAITTAFAIARICNSTEFWREITVSAAESLDANHRPLEYHWVILRGDPELIKIEEVRGNPTARRIRVGYHERRPVQAGSNIESSRVDIALITHNGVHYSAPAILSFTFPGNEKRVYDAQQKILSVDYLSSTSNYVDPAWIPERLWKDEYHYDDKGARTGWTRIRGNQREEFNAYGDLLVTETNGAQPVAKRVVYQRLNHTDGRPYISQKIVEE